MLKWFVSLLTLFAVLLGATGAIAFDHRNDDGHDRKCNPDDAQGGGQPSDPPCDPCRATGSPVYLVDGNYVKYVVDLVVPSSPPVIVGRSYNSIDDREGLVGARWTHSLETRLIPTFDGVDETIVVRWPNGQRQDFLRQPDGSYSAPLGFDASIAKSEDGFVLRRNDLVSYVADEQGLIQAVLDLNGNRQTWNYSVDRGCPSAIETNLGVVMIERDANGRISSVADPAGNTVAYSYSPDGNLEAVRNPLGELVESYQYDAAGRLVRVLDGIGREVAAVGYDADGRVSQLVDGDGSYAYEYLPGQNQTRKISLNDGGSWTYDVDDQGVVVAMTNPLGQTTRYEFDGEYNLVSTTFPGGSSERQEFDVAGNVVAHVDARGGRTEFEYDELGMATRVVDPLGRETRLERDSNGNIEREILPDGTELHYTYDNRGNRLSASNGEGETTSYEYDDRGLLNRVVDPEGRETAFARDSLGRIVAEDRSGSVHQTEYDGVGRLRANVDPVGNRTEYEWDSSGNLTQITLPTGDTIRREFDAHGREISRSHSAMGEFAFEYVATGDPNEPDAVRGVSPSGRTKETFLDPDGRVTRTVVSYKGDARETLYEYDSAGDLVGVQLPGGRSVRFEVDESGDVVWETYGDTGLGVATSYLQDGSIGEYTTVLGNTVSYVYDGNGREAGGSDLLGDVGSRQYDKAGRVKSRRSPGSESSSVGYDRSGNTIDLDYNDGTELGFEWSNRNELTTFRGPRGTVDLSRDDKGRVTRVTLENGDVVQAGYDELDNVSSLRDADGEVTAYDFDGAGRLTRLEYPDGSDVRLGYQGEMMLPSRIDRASGRFIEMEYGVEGELVHTEASSGYSVAYEYNDSGSLATANDGVSTVVRTEDGIGRLVAETQGVHTVSYEYSSDGRTVTVVYPSGLRVTQHLDIRGQVVGIDVNDVTVLENIIGSDGYLQAAVYGNGVEAGVEYHPDGTPARLRYTTSAAVLFDREYVQDSEGWGEIRLVRDLVDDSASSTYARDSRGRLVEYRRGLLTGDGEIVTATSEAVWDLTGVGNWETVTRSGDVENRQFNELHQVTIRGGVPLQWDADGNLLGDGVRSYEWDDWGRLAGVRESDTNNLIAEYQYDPLGRRRAKITPVGTTEYVYDGDHLIEERVGGAVRRSYVYEAGSSRPTCFIEDGSFYYYVQDALGNIVAVVDANGSTVGSYRYSPYGVVELQAGGGAARWGFGGMYGDEETGLWFAKNRYYDPSLGCFLSRDPLDRSGGFGPWSLYTYAMSDPITFVDSDGMIPRPTKGCTYNRFNLSRSWKAPGILSKVLKGFKIEAYYQRSFCLSCCDSGEWKPSVEFAFVGNFVVDTKCIPVYPILPVWLVNLFTPIEGDFCGGVYLFFQGKVGGQLNLKFSGCDKACSVSGCVGGRLGVWVRGGIDAGEDFKAWVGGYFGWSGRYCAKPFRCGDDVPSIRDLLDNAEYVGCWSGKIEIRYQAKLGWIGWETYGSWTIIEGQWCNKESAPIVF